MKKLALCSAVSALGLLMATSASAHDEGWYLRGNAGYGVHTDTELTGDVVSEVHGNGLQSEGGLGASLGLGYDFGDNWRLELDGDTLFTEFGSISQVPSSFAKLRTDSLMLNALYDFDGFGNFEPYVGAGLGFVRGDASIVAHDFINVSDTDTGFGWQLLAGLGYKVSENLTWDTHYTYLNAPTFDYEGLRTNGVTGASDAISAELSDVAAHTVMTGLRYTFGHQHEAPRAVTPVAPIPAPRPTYTCWDNSIVENAGQCAPKPAPVQLQTCWDGSSIPVGDACPARPAPQPVPQVQCWDNSLVSNEAFCPERPVVVEPVVQQTNLNLCGSSPVAIFNVPVNSTPKQMARLGTMPEFGDSHGLTPSQFYEKLNSRYNSNAVDKAYLNYLFKSMGYANGWADAQPYMFSEEVLPVGTRGMLGLGEQHHYAYSILPTNERDRHSLHEDMW